MIINKGIQAVAKNIASDINTRPKLAGVQFQNNKAIATDGYKLMEVSFNKDIPGLPQLKNFTNMNRDDSIMISKEDINALKIPNTKIKENDIIQIGNINNECDGSTEISIGTFDLKRETIINTKGIDGTFLDYKCFFSTDINFIVGLDIKYLMDLLKTYQAFGIDKIELHFDSNDNKKPITIINYEAIKDQNIEQVKSILMPLKIK